MDTAVPSAPRNGAAVSTYIAYGTKATPAQPQHSVHTQTHGVSFRHTACARIPELSCIRLAVQRTRTSFPSK